MTLDPNSQAIAKLIELRKRAKDLRPAFQSAADVGRSMLKKHFDAEGYGWAVLATSTIQMRGNRKGYYKKRASSEGPAHRILHWSGRLKKSLTVKGHRFHISRSLTHKSFEFGTRDPKARGHQFGRGRRPLPKREVLPKGKMILLFHREVKHYFEDVIKGRVA